MYHRETFSVELLGIFPPSKRKQLSFVAWILNPCSDCCQVFDVTSCVNITYHSISVTCCFSEKIDLIVVDKSFIKSCKLNQMECLMEIYNSIRIAFRSSTLHSSSLHTAFPLSDVNLFHYSTLSEHSLPIGS